MKEMTTQELTTYLKHAAELEASVYRQEAVVKKANNNLRYKEPQETFVAMPMDGTEFLEPPAQPNIKIHKINMLIWLVWLVEGIWGILEFIDSFFTEWSPYASNVWESQLFWLLLGISGLIGGGIGLVVTKKRIMTENKKYDDLMKQYERNVEAEREAYAQKMQEYERRKRTAEKEYHVKLASSKRNFEVAKREVQKLEISLTATRKLLEQLYTADIIFPKYRDMVAMCTIYEYFASGRCTELTGPNGAYNLYEAELRQNVIINRLDKIVSQLDQIKQNQYVLYQELKHTDQLLQGIADDIRVIMNSTDKIARASAIAAHHTQVTAQNTEALKYITLIS